MPRPASHPCIRVLAAALVIALASSFGAAQDLPDLDLAPHLDAAGLRADLADPIRAATAWLFEEDDDAITVWIWRVPGDPEPIGLFDAADWAPVPDVMPRDLGEAMAATVEFFGPFFDEADPSWSGRALALVGELAGIEQVLVSYSVFVGDGSVIYGVQVMDPFVDLVALEVLEGTWVQVSRLAE